MQLSNGGLLQIPLLGVVPDPLENMMYLGL